MQRPLFSIFGVPVSISIWHFVFLFLLASNWFNSRHGMLLGLIFVAVGSLSILAHELGHALTSKFFGLEPRIELVMFGGMTYHEPARRLRDDFLIVAAGPGVNYLIALGAWLAPDLDGVAGLALQVATMINFWWGTFNLLPIIPMDGGQLLRVILQATLKPLPAARWTHRVGMALGGAAALYFMTNGSPLAGVFLLSFVFQNWQMLQAIEHSPGAKAAAKHGRVRELVEQARESFAQGDFAATSRLAHLARAEPYVSQVELEHIWQLLALAAARSHQFEEALRYAERVPRSAEMALVQAHCLAMIGDVSKIQRFLSTPAALQLPEERVAELQELARNPQASWTPGN